MPQIAKMASENTKDGPDMLQTLQIIDFWQKMVTQKNSVPQMLKSALSLILNHFSPLLLQSKLDYFTLSTILS